MLNLSLFSNSILVNYYDEFKSKVNLKINDKMIFLQNNKTHYFINNKNDKIIKLPPKKTNEIEDLKNIYFEKKREIITRKENTLKYERHMKIECLVHSTTNIELILK